LTLTFKIDENLPIEAAILFADGGYDAATVHDQAMSGRSDQDLAVVCQKEERTIITLDLDFADIRAYSPGDYPGIIVLRLTRTDSFMC
jgi:predicted nuclease of predicted toxin-antitoxin system